MRPLLELVRREPRTRRFLLAQAQSSLGTGAGYVGLLVLVYERTGSPWLVSLVLLADFAPSIFLGPLFGAAADRWSQRGCLVVSDVVRAIAFLGLAVVGSAEQILLFALLAGLGTGLFNPTVMAALPRLVSRDEVPAATAAFGAVADFGRTAGPMLAALALLFFDAPAIMAFNAVTFAISAAVVARIRFDTGSRRKARESSIFADAWEGLQVTTRLQGVRTVVMAGGAGILFGGMLNVGELLLSTDELGAGGAGFSVLVAVHGLGLSAGSITGGRGGRPAALKKMFLVGMTIEAIAILLSGLAPIFLLAVVTFLVTGFGNGVAVVHERLLIQTIVPDRLVGRVFGVREMIDCCAFAIAFLAAGAVASAFGARVLFLLTGAACLTICAAAAWALRTAWVDDPGGAPLLPDPSPA